MCEIPLPIVSSVLYAKSCQSVLLARYIRYHFVFMPSIDTATHYSIQIHPSLLLFQTIYAIILFLDDLNSDACRCPLQIIYTACSGGQKGISFKDLLCGLVVITKGTVEEKTRRE